MGSGADKTKEQLANDRQVGGSHYKGKVQHWDIAAQEEWDYFTGQVTKYMWRWPKKNGIQDLRKALHFLQKLIELVESGQMVKTILVTHTNTIHPINCECPECTGVQR